MPMRRRFRKKVRGKVAQPVKAYVKRAMKAGVEVKRLDTVSATFAPGAAGVVVYCSGIPQGTTYTNRLGNRVHARGFVLRVRAMCPLAAAPPVLTDNAILRIIVFQYKEAPIGGTVGAPAVSDIIIDATVAGAVSDYQSGISYPNRRGIHVLADRQWAITGSNAGVYQDTKAMRISIPFKRMLKELQYIGTTGANNSAGYGALYFLAIASSANVLMEYSAQFSFSDE